jgi:hypothetical protein
MPALTIRGLSKESLAALSERASKNRVSQQEYLRRVIRLHLIQPEVVDVLTRQEEALKMCAMVIKENTEVMHAFIEINGG